MSTWVQATTIRVGMVVRVKPPGRRLATARDGGVVRQIEADGQVLVEPDFPDVDDDGMFAMWGCRKDQLLVEKRQ